jgi:small conductance mechanosensitive channel
MGEFEITDAQIDMIVQLGTKGIGALLFLITAFIIAGWISRAVLRSLERAKFDLTLSRFLAKFVRWSILLMTVLACLGIFGIPTTSFAAVIGAAGLAIGLAFQGTLANFSSGVMILVFRPFKVGDVVTAAGQTGKVYETGLFSTTMDTPDNRRFIIPNSSVFGSTIENVSYHDTRRVDVTVGVDYTADLDRVRKVFAEAIAGLPGLLTDPEPAIVLSELGASSVDWTVKIWCNKDDFWDLKEAALESIKKKLDAEGIGIPYPQMDVHLDK